jgi:hypothetical protein
MKTVGFLVAVKYDTSWDAFNKTDMEAALKLYGCMDGYEVNELGEVDIYPDPEETTNG